MTLSRLFPWLVGVVGALLLAGGALLVPFEVRNSAVAGYTQTLDPERGIAVRGARVPINYPNFRRIDLDLRAYSRPPRFDITVHVRPAEPGATDVRVIPLSVTGEEVWHDKGAFADPFTRVEFEPIAGSAGQRYDIRIETGPRNRDDVLALWSIKTYSRTTGREVLAAFVDHAPGTGAPGVPRGVLVGLLIALVAAFGWLLAGVSRLVVDGFASGAGPAVSSDQRRWYTLARFERRRRSVRPSPPEARQPPR